MGSKPVQSNFGIPPVTATHPLLVSSNKPMIGLSGITTDLGFGVSESPPVLDPPLGV